jgi:uncharacterized sporulation protein YeaH/YhbH (DUF444 family)
VTLDEALKVAEEACRTIAGLYQDREPNKAKDFYFQCDLAAAALAKLRANIEAEAKRVAHIEADERFHYPKAIVQVNAPLAMIQLCMEVERDTFRSITSLDPPSGGGT